MNEVQRIDKIGVISGALVNATAFCDTVFVCI